MLLHNYVFSLLSPKSLLASPLTTAPRVNWVNPELSTHPFLLSVSHGLFHIVASRGKVRRGVRRRFVSRTNGEGEGRKAQKFIRFVSESLRRGPSIMFHVPLQSCPIEASDTDLTRFNTDTYKLAYKFYNLRILHDGFCANLLYLLFRYPALFPHSPVDNRCDRNMVRRYMREEDGHYMSAKNYIVF